MIIRVLLALIITGALFYVIANFRKQTKAQQKKLAFKLGITLLVGVLLLLVVTGRIHWIGAIVAGLLPFLKRSLPLLLRALPFLAQLKRKHAAGSMSSGNQSTVQTEYLSLQLNHDTGEISGSVINGQYAGKKLSELSKAECRTLLAFYQTTDDESHQLLLAYLQKIYGEEFFESAEEQPHYTASGNMNRQEALDILGLDKDATEEDIKAAHKKLMQKMHPDRGGSNYLAAKINEAKDFLLKD